MMKKMLVLFFMLVFATSASAVDNWTYGPADPADPAFGDTSVAYHDNTLIYSSGKIVYGMDLDTGVSTVMCEPDLEGGQHSVGAWAPSGFLVSNDGESLFFHDNGFPTTYIFNYNFGDSADTYTPFDTQCDGSIYSLAQNPWTDTLWFATGDISGDNLYLYEILGADDNRRAILRATVAKRHSDRSSGNGPIIFKGPGTVLFGEAEGTWDGNDDGYFHLVDTTIGTVISEDYITFDGGIAAAAYGYNNEIYAATGDGKSVLKISYSLTETVTTTTNSVRGMAFGGNPFYLAEMDPAWAISGSVLTNTTAATVVSATDNFRTASLPLPVPGIQDWNHSVAFYGNGLIYSDNINKDIYSCNLNTGESELLVDVDFSAGSANAFGPSGFVVGQDGYLYFHDNGNPTTFIYRHKLGTVDYEPLDLGTTISGSIFSMTQNPWTGSLWIASSPFGGADLYLYEINTAFDGVSQDFDFAKEHADRASGNGPIIFSSQNSLLYGEAEGMWDGFDKGYFHKVDVAEGTIITDCMEFDGGLASAVYGYDYGIFVGTGNGNSVYVLDPENNTKTKVADSVNSITGMAFDGFSFFMAGATPTWTYGLDALWMVALSGVPDDQQAPQGLVSDDADLAVITTNPEKAVGIEGSANTFVEALEAVEPGDIDETAGRPENLPYELISFRVKGDSIGFAATIIVHFSDPLPFYAKWWKYDPINGWYEFPNAVLSGDGLSMTLTIVDGGFGDADGIANGYVTDPGGPGFQTHTVGTWIYGPSNPADPAPGEASVAYHDNTLIYSSGKIVYGMDLDTGVSTVMCEPDLVGGQHSANAWAPSGFLVSNDGESLFFHDNGFPTTYIFSYNFGDSADTYTPFDTQCEGSIYSLAQNPWTDTLWFASGDMGGDNLYLYEILGDGDNRRAILRATVVKRHSDRSSGNGPIIFKGPSTVLFGEAEALWDGQDNGYFHLVDATIGTVIFEDYITFDGGIAAAAYGYNNEIYAATGDGKNVLKILHSQTETVLTATDSVRGMAFGGNPFYLAEMDPAWAINGSVLTDTAAITVVSCTDDFRTASLPLPDPEVHGGNLSVAFYGNGLIYSDAAQQDIYSYNLSTGETEILVDVDFSAGSAGAFGPSGFVVGQDGYLYFHDNGNPTTFIYRHKLGTVDYEPLDLGTTISGSIFSMTQNPWTGSLWIASATGENLYLYEINAAFDGIAQDFDFAKEHADRASGNGPIIFSSQDSLLYGEAEAMWDDFDKGYFHKLDVATGTVLTDCMEFEGGLASAVYGYDHEIFVSTGNGKSVYVLDPVNNAKTKVAESVNSIIGLAFDGFSFFITGYTPTWAYGIDALWTVAQSGVPEDQQAPQGSVSDDADLAVITANPAKAVGLEGAANTFVEALEAVDTADIDTTIGRPEKLPYGLINFRVKGDSIGFAATIIVHFSDPLPSDAKWWKYDPINGWYEFPNAVLSGDGLSMTLTIVDGGFGDADGIANGYVTDPGGPGFQTPDAGVAASSGSSGSCFIGAISTEHDFSGRPGSALLVIAALFAVALPCARHLAKTTR